MSVEKSSPFRGSACFFFFVTVPPAFSDRAPCQETSPYTQFSQKLYTSDHVEHVGVRQSGKELYKLIRVFNTVKRNSLSQRSQS